MGARLWHQDRMQTWRARETEIDGHGGRGVLAFYEGGPAERPIDVVFLHANGFNARTYCSILAPLTDRLHILILDQQGHGRSPLRVEPEGRSDALDLRDDLIGFLEAVSPGRPVVLSGHSLGGCVSILAAAHEPQRVRALALFDPVILSRERSREAIRTQAPLSHLVGIARAALQRRPHFPSKAAAFERYQGRGAFATWPDEVLRDYVEDGFRERPEGDVELVCSPEWEASNFRAHSHDIWDALARLKAPMTILRAEEGSTCALESASEVPEATIDITTMPGTTHFLPMERQDDARRVLLQTVG